MINRVFYVVLTTDLISIMMKNYPSYSLDWKSHGILFGKGNYFKTFDTRHICWRWCASTSTLYDDRFIYANIYIELLSNLQHNRVKWKKKRMNSNFQRSVLIGCKYQQKKKLKHILYFVFSSIEYCCCLNVFTVALHMYIYQNRKLSQLHLKEL